MWWPFTRTEKREQTEGDYTDQLLARVEAQAFGNVPAADTLAVAETAISLWERAVAALTVEPMNNRLMGLNPQCLALVGRDLALYGNSLHKITIRDGAVALVPASTLSVVGDADPDTWLYLTTTVGPSNSTTERIPSAGVLHFRLGVSSWEPWRGVAPLRRGSATAKLAAAIEMTLTKESRLPVGRIAPSGGHNPKTGEAGYGDDLIRGGLVVAGSTVVGPGAMATGEILSSRLKPAAYGPEPDQVMEGLRTSAGRDVLSAFGVPPALFEARGDGAGQVASWQRFLTSTVAPMARLIETELRLKLEPLATVSTGELRTDDGRERLARATRSRAQAFKVLKESGLEDDEAKRLAGLA